MSCFSDIELNFPSNFVKDNGVILIGELNLKDHIQEKEFSIVSVKRGSIAVSINSQIENIEAINDGLLNLNKEEFVIFPVYYGQQSGLQNVMPHSVVIDSTLCYKSTGAFYRRFLS